MAGIAGAQVKWSFVELHGLVKYFEARSGHSAGFIPVSAKKSLLSPPEPGNFSFVTTKTARIPKKYNRHLNGIIGQSEASSVWKKF